VQAVALRRLLTGVTWWSMCKC